MIPFPSHFAPGLAAWAESWMQEVRALAVPQGPTPLWSCAEADLPPAEAHPNAVLQVAESGATAVSTVVAGAWTWVHGPALAPVQVVAGKTGAVTLVKADVGLGSVDNTADVSKPVSSAQAAAIADARGMRTWLITSNGSVPYADKDLLIVNDTVNDLTAALHTAHPEGSRIICYARSTGVLRVNRAPGMGFETPTGFVGGDIQLAPKNAVEMVVVFGMGVARVMIHPLGSSTYSVV